jgi:tripartite-type tricarboxylate transporter receptor subunit TctC
MKILNRALYAAAFLFALGLSGASLAQSFPTKPVWLVVPYPPGGATDQIARALAQALSEKWKQPVIIDNRSGASATIGAASVAKAKPDGYTLLISDSSVFVMVPHLLEQVPFDVRKDFTPVTIVARQAAVLATRKSFPASNTRELIEYIRANPGKVTYGSFGTGTWAHISMEELSRLANLQMLHVPFRGGAQALTEMMAERIDLYFATMGAVAQYKEAGKLKVLSTATPKRLPSQPDLPTMAEDGLPGYSLSVWFGLAAPAHTPIAIVDKIQKDIAELNADPAFQEKVLKTFSLEPGGETREEFARILRTEYERWGRVVNDAHLKEKK